MFHALCLLASLGQDSTPPAAPETLLALDWRGVEAFLADEKDQPLLGALRLVDERLLELPAELGSDDLPPQAIDLGLRLLGGPIELRLALDTQPVEGQPLPLVAELRLPQASAAAASALFDDVRALIQSAGGPPIENPPAGELARLVLPVPVWMGVQDAAFVVRTGRQVAFPPADAAQLLHRGARPYLSGRLAYGRLLGLFAEALAADAAGELDDLWGPIELLQLDELEYEWAAGHDGERQHFVFNMPGWAATAREQGLLPEQTIPREFLALVPWDATWASLAVYEPSALWRIVTELAGEELPLQEFEDSTGILVYDDLVEPLGDVVAVYGADSTGGGGLMATVAVLALDDAATLESALSQLTDMADGLGAGIARGYVRFARREHDATRFTTLTFPGLPVPFELTLAITERYAFAGFSPQAVDAAVAQARGGQRGLADNPAFREQLPGALEGCSAIQWMDTARLLPDGYGTLALATAALSNAVRSPSDATREPGRLLPGFLELSSGAKALVGVTRVVGGDLRTEYRSDSSQLVNAAGVAGLLWRVALLPLVGFGSVLGAAAEELAGGLGD